MTQELAQKAIKRAMTESAKFNSTYNEIPVFMIQQMRIQTKPEKEGGKVEQVRRWGWGGGGRWACIKILVNSN